MAGCRVNDAGFDALHNVCNSYSDEELAGMSCSQLTDLQTRINTIRDNVISAQNSNAQCNDPSDPSSPTPGSPDNRTTAQITASITELRTQLQGLTNGTTTQTALQTRIAQLERQERLLREKEQMVASRNRMLQYNLERQAYKRKWIYILISLLFAVLLLVMVIYVGVEKTKQMFGAVGTTARTA